MISDGRVFGVLFYVEFLLDELVSVELLLRDGWLKACQSLSEVFWTQSQSAGLWIHTCITDTEMKKEWRQVVQTLRKKQRDWQSQARNILYSTHTWTLHQHIATAQGYDEGKWLHSVTMCRVCFRLRVSSWNMDTWVSCIKCTVHFFLV